MVHDLMTPWPDTDALLGWLDAVTMTMHMDDMLSRDDATDAPSMTSSDHFMGDSLLHVTVHPEVHGWQCATQLHWQYVQVHGHISVLIITVNSVTGHGAAGHSTVYGAQPHHISQ